MTNHELGILVPVVFEEMSMQQLQNHLPELSDDQIRTELIRKALVDAKGDLSRCRMKLHIGDPWPEFGLCVLEVTDEGVRDRFDLAPFYVYRGVEIERRAEAVPFKNLGDAVTYFQSEETS